jgi:hypothetical protein
MQDQLPVSLYFMPEWWDCHYHRDHPRPQTVSQAGLESMYLGRQKFLFTCLGEFQIGQEQPSRAGGQIATLIRYGFDLVPALLGVTLDRKDAWGFYPRFKALSDVRDLKPVDIARHPEGDWLQREKARLESLYGECRREIDIGSVCNNAFRIIGEELYLGVAEDPSAIAGLFDVVIETEEMLYRFLCELFGPIDPVPISNCNVHLMGPRHYEELVLPYDARQNRFHALMTGSPPRAALHHCDVPVDDFLAAYSRLPGLCSLQASLQSNITAAKRLLPDCLFSALISPTLVCGSMPALEEKLRSAFSQGVDDLAVWNVDQRVTLPVMTTLLAAVQRISGEFGKEAVFTALPLCWEELEWAHADYAGPNPERSPFRASP